MNCQAFKKNIVYFFAILFLFTPFITHALSITVSPGRQAVIVARGTTQRVFVNVINNDITAETFVPQVDAFTINPETGRAVFGGHEEAIGWVTPFPESLTIKPKEKGTFFFDISIPKSTEVRSRYLGLFVIQKPPEAQVAIGSRVGSLLFLHIQGVVSEQLVEVAFSSNKKILLTPHAILALALKNVGTIHSIPRGSVLVMRGGTTLKEFPLNDTAKKVLPEGLWKSSYALEGLSFHDIGKLEVSAIVRYGPDNRELITRTTVWYLPWQILIAGLAVVFVVVFFAFRMQKRLKRVSL